MGKNYAEGIKNLNIAVEKGLAEAYYRLGWCYKAGQGVSKDYKQFIKAADESFYVHDIRYMIMGFL